MISHQKLNPQESVARIHLLASLHSIRPVLFPSVGEVVGLSQAVARINVRPGLFLEHGRHVGLERVDLPLNWGYPIAWVQ